MEIVGKLTYRHGGVRRRNRLAQRESVRLAEAPARVASPATTFGRFIYPLSQILVPAENSILSNRPSRTEGPRPLPTVGAFLEQKGSVSFGAIG
jgi:hypothetical protein